MNSAEFLNLMSQHQGRERGIRCAELATKAAVTERAVRKLVSELRREGVAICAKPKTGYYLAVTPEELNESCRFLHARAMSSLQKASLMQKISLPALVGQLFLNQA